MGFQSGWTVHNSSIDNLSRGILERVYLHNGNVPVQPLPGIYKQLHYFRGQVCRKIGQITPMNIQDFPDCYRGRLQTIYQKAVDDLLINPVVREDSHIKAFVKAERVNIIDKPDPVARVIQPRSPRYNASLGVFVKNAEKRIYRAIAAIFGECTIMKELNAVSQAAEVKSKWAKYSKPVAIGLDASRFDQHVGFDALQYEHGFYTGIYNNDSELNRLLSWQLSNVGRGYCNDGKLKYTVRGCRMSGDMNTGLGNCIIMCALVHNMCRQIGIKKFSLCNNGDDCVIIMDQSDLDTLTREVSQYFKNFGFVIKVEEPVYEFEKIEFCQTSPIWNGEEYVMVRKPKRSLSKDSISIVPMDTLIGCLKQMTALGECGLAINSGIPIMQSFYSCLLRSGRGKRGKVDNRNMGYYMPLLLSGLSARARPISEVSRWSFYVGFGIEPDMQRAIEHHYDSLTISGVCQTNVGELLLPEWI